MGHSDTGEQTLEASDDAVTPVFIDARAPEHHSGQQGLIEPTTGSSLAELADAAPGTLAPDWDAWAQILALGAPLAGRTPFEGFHRLQPAESAQCGGSSWHLAQQPWGWEAVEPDPGLNPEDLTGSVLEALRARIAAIPGPLNPMLSGGRDSRLLTALAAQQSSQVTAWTTSSDTGTSMEELVAARIAGVLGVEHRIVPGVHDEFADDVRAYGQTVDYMASFHFWLMPVARQLRQHPGTILDGLGGGVFLGGGFPDSPELSEGTPSAQQAVDSRFTRMARYLEAADEIFADGVGVELVDRARADFDPIAHRFADHPNGATLTAYLTRTLPGISMAPSCVLAGAQPTVMPIMDDEVITQALRVPNAKKHDGVWYPHLLTQADQRLTDQPTAADLTGRRQHVRRGASQAAAQWYRSLLLNSQAGELLSEQMRTASIAEWSDQLSKTKPQHLLRGLAMLALWLEEHQGQLGTVELPFGKASHV